MGMLFGTSCEANQLARLLHKSKKVQVPKEGSHDA
jgi:hypothetical protein